MKFMLIYLMTAFSLAAVGSAYCETDTEEDEAVSWREKREELHEKVIAQLHEKVTEKSVAEAVGMEYPPPEPARSTAEVEKLIEAAVDRKVDEEYPLSMREAFEDEAKEAVQLWEVGDKVRIDVGGPRPREVEGVLRVIAQDVIRVGDQTIPSVDLDEETRAHLYEEELQKERENYVRVKTNKFFFKRSQYAREIEPEIRERLYRENGYVQVHGRWYPAAFVIAKVTEARREKLQPAIEQEIFTANGFVQYEEQWIPRENAEVRAAIEKARETEDPAEAVHVLEEVIEKFGSASNVNQAKALLKRLKRGDDISDEAPPPLPPGAGEEDLRTLRERLFGK